MFGILYSLFMSIGVIGHNAKENYYESVRKDKAKDSYDRIKLSQIVGLYGNPL